MAALSTCAGISCSADADILLDQMMSPEFIPLIQLIL